jgi:hypothetical protein
MENVWRKKKYHNNFKDIQRMLITKGIYVTLRQAWDTHACLTYSYDKLGNSTMNDVFL